MINSLAELVYHKDVESGNRNGRLCGISLKQETETLLQKSLDSVKGSDIGGNVR